MKLGNLLMCWVVAVVAWAGVCLLGWALSFAFSYEVFVPWLGCVPQQYHRLAAFVSAFIFDGVGAFVVLFVLALMGLGAYKVTRKSR